MSAAKDAKLRAQLPKVESEEIQRLLNDPTLILYTDSEMPPAYQDWSSGLPGIHSPDYNLSANNTEPHGNGNIEFPWGTPGGTHRTSNVSTFRFLWLPQNEQGNQHPIVWFPKFLRGGSSKGYAWTFPVGAIVGEVLQMRSPAGNLYTFELRLRIREYGEWAVDVYRPFPTSDALVHRIKELRPQWTENKQLTKLVQHLEKPVNLKSHTLADSRHPRVSFRQSMGVDTLPAAGDDQLVAQLLTETTFRSALGETWRTGANGVSTAAPTTVARFHVIPARYDAGFIEVDRFSCMRCHETVNHNVNDFQFGRDWYGRVRGSDGIFSFHPFAHHSISYNGFSGGSPQMNGKLISGRVLERFNRRKHSIEVYQKVPQLVE